MNRNQKKIIGSLNSNNYIKPTPISKIPPKVTDYQNKFLEMSSKNIVYTDGSWETDKNNIYYNNDGGAVSVNTQNIQYFPPFSNDHIIESPNTNSYFGGTNTIGNYGNTLFVSDISNKRIDLYNYSVQLNNWGTSPVSTITSPISDSSSQFGFSLSNVNNYLLVGDPGVSTIYLYDVCYNDHSFKIDVSFTYTNEDDDNPNFGFACKLDKRPNYNQYSIIASSPNTNDIFWWVDKTDLTLEYAFEFNGTDTSPVQAGYSVDLKWKNDTEYFTAIGIPFKNKVSFNAASSTYINYKNVGQIIYTYNDILSNYSLQYAQFSWNNVMNPNKQTTFNNVNFGSNISIDPLCEYIFVSSPGYSYPSPNDISNNGILEAYLLAPKQTSSNIDYDLSYVNMFSIDISQVQIGQYLQSYINIDNNYEKLLSFGCPLINNSYLIDFDARDDSFGTQTDISFNGTSTDISMGFSPYFSYFDNNKDQSLFMVGSPENKPQKVTIFNNVGKYNFNVLGDNYMNGNLLVTGELQGPTIKTLLDTITQMQSQINALESKITK